MAAWGRVFRSPGLGKCEVPTGAITRSSVAVILNINRVGVVKSACGAMCTSCKQAHSLTSVTATVRHTNAAQCRTNATQCLQKRAQLQL